MITFLDLITWWLEAPRSTETGADLESEKRRDRRGVQCFFLHAGLSGGLPAVGISGFLDISNSLIASC